MCVCVCVCVCVRAQEEGFGEEGRHLRCEVFQSCRHIVHCPAIKVVTQGQPGQQQVTLPSSLQGREVGGFHTKNSCVLCHSLRQETQQLLYTGNPRGGGGEEGIRVRGKGGGGGRGT